MSLDNSVFNFVCMGEQKNHARKIEIAILCNKQLLLSSV